MRERLTKEQIEEAKKQEKEYNELDRKIIQAQWQLYYAQYCLAKENKAWKTKKQ